MYYRRSGSREVPAAGSSVAQANRAALKRVVDTGPPPGLIGYRGMVPVGWVALGPREQYLKLRRSPVMKPIDEQPVWSIICFVVPSEYRRQGVASALLAAAVAYAKKQGASLIEAYPVDKAGEVAGQWLWHGAKAMYDRAGFVEVARRRPERPMVRLPLTRRTAKDHR